MKEFLKNIQPEFIVAYVAFAVMVGILVWELIKLIIFIIKNKF